MVEVPPPARRELRGLTGLRGVAALWVFTFHLFFSRPVPVFEFGYLGVDVFFVLSGFVLCYAHAQTSWNVRSYGRFLRSRVARLWPMHVFALALLLAIVLLDRRIADAFGESTQWRFGRVELLASLGLVQNWGFVTPGAWNAPTWSLSAEWFASLTFPICTLAVRRVCRWETALLLALTAMALLVMFLWRIDHPDPSVIGCAGMVRMALEFASGGLAFRAYSLGYRPSPIMSAIALAALGLGVASIVSAHVMLFSLPFLTLAAADDRSWLAQALGVAPVAFFGRISYSFFLLHWIMLLVAGQVADALGLSGTGFAIGAAGLFVFITGFSVVTYASIEVPCRQWLEAAWRRGRPPILRSGVHTPAG